MFFFERDRYDCLLLVSSSFFLNKKQDCTHSCFSVLWAQLLIARAARKHVRNKKKDWDIEGSSPQDKEFEYRVLESFRGVLEAAGTEMHPPGQGEQLSPDAGGIQRYRVRKQNRC